VTCTQAERDAQELQQRTDLERVRKEMGLTLGADGEPTKDNTVPDIDDDSSLQIPNPETIPRFEKDEEYSTRTRLKPQSVG
jgi:hypothetical protein